MLKERLCFDPEFWNLFTLRTHCLELMSDNIVKDAVLSEIKEEEEKAYHEELLPNNCRNESCTVGVNSSHSIQTALVNQDHLQKQAVDVDERKCVVPNNTSLKRKWRHRLRERRQSLSDDEFEPGNDPEFKYNLKSASLRNKPMYSLRQNHSIRDHSASVKLPLKRKREYLSRCVKSQILKRKGRKKRWLQGLPRLEQVQTYKETKLIVGGKKRGRKPLPKLELSFPDNEIYLSEESSGFVAKTNTKDSQPNVLNENIKLVNKCEEKENGFEHLIDPTKENGDDSNLVCDRLSKLTQEELQTKLEAKLCDDLQSRGQAAVPAAEANPELDGPLFEYIDNPVEMFHNYSLQSGNTDKETPQPPEQNESGEINGEAEQEPKLELVTEVSKSEVSYLYLLILFVNLQLLSQDMG